MRIARTAKTRSTAKTSDHRSASRNTSGQRKSLSASKLIFLTMAWILYAYFCSVLTAGLVLWAHLPLQLGMLHWLFTVLFPVAYLAGPAKFLALLNSLLKAIRSSRSS
jgi:hypothetical protein